MATGFYIGVDGKARKVKGGYIGIDGVARKIKKGYVGVDGIARLFYSSGKRLTDYELGSTVYLLENGSPVEYLIVHKGLPSDMYDNSCDGVWLLRKDIYELRAWDSSDNDYQNSDIHVYLNETFLSLFDEKTESKILQAKIPYVNGTKNSPVASGANGLSTKVFLLGGYEVGFKANYFPVDGAKLDYFESGDTSGGTNRRKRIAYHNGTATNWWLRSLHTSTKTDLWYVAPSGTNSSTIYYSGYGIRPALILPHNMDVDPNTNIVTG